MCESITLSQVLQEMEDEGTVRTHLRTDLLSGLRRISFCQSFGAATGQMTSVLRYVTKSLWSVCHHVMNGSTSQRN